MELTDLQKLESAPDLKSILYGLPERFYLDDILEHEVELQNHFDQSGFNFLIPTLDEREYCSHYFDKDASIYLYRVLNSTFGSPTFRGRLSKNAESYLLTSGICIFEVKFHDDFGSLTTTSSTRVMGRAGNVESNRKKFVDVLQSEIRKLKHSNWLDTLAPESATYFENPFNFYFEQGRKQLDAIIFYKDRLFEELLAIEEEIEYVDEGGFYRIEEQTRIDRGVEFFDYYGEESAEVEDTLSNLRRLKEKQERLEYFENISRTAVFFLFIASLEGLLNLVYEVYLFKELREDERIKAFISRAQIDIKLRAMPVYCSCFNVHLIDSDETFKKIHSIFNLRNDLIHANMTSAMTAKRYEVHGRLFHSHEDKKNKYSLPQTARSLTIENLQFVCEAVEKMVENIMVSMKPRYKREFERVLHQDGFYARLIDGEYLIDADDE